MTSHNADLGIVDIVYNKIDLHTRAALPSLGFIHRLQRLQYRRFNILNSSQFVRIVKLIELLRVH
jgi:hypothetical protein